MTFTSHLGELRRRLMICIVALTAGTIICFIYRDFLFEILKRPGNHPQLYFHEITGAVGPVFKVAMMGGFILAFPVIVHQIIMFLAPGLTSKEKRYLYLLLPGVTLFFLAGAAFAYFVLLPPILDFLFNWSSEIATPLVDIGSYVNTVVSIVFWMGVGFETPFVMYLLTVLRIGSPKMFNRFRKYWFVVTFILGAAITPTFDPVNQLMVASPFIVLYEVGIVFSRIAVRKPRAAAALPDVPSNPG